jgi:sulfur carrier protein ThiS
MPALRLEVEEAVVLAVEIRLERMPTEEELEVQDHLEITEQTEQAAAVEVTVTLVAAEREETEVQEYSFLESLQVSYRG